MAYYKCGAGKVAPEYLTFYQYTGSSLDISWLDPSKLTTLARLFYDCPNLASLDMSNFTDVSATNLSMMFYGCSSLTSLDLQNLNVSPTNVGTMFKMCYSLLYLDISSMSFDNVGETSYGGMFSGVPFGCTILVKDAAAQSWLSSKFPDYTFTIKS